jgi:hypothetical protein
LLDSDEPTVALEGGDARRSRSHREVENQVAWPAVRLDQILDEIKRLLRGMPRAMDALEGEEIARVTGDRLAIVVAEGASPYGSRLLVAGGARASQLLQSARVIRGGGQG